MTQLVDWDLAVSTATRLAGGGPSVSYAEAADVVAELRRATAESEVHVQDFTHLHAKVDHPPVRVVDRGAWAEINVAGFQTVLAPVVLVALYVAIRALLTAMGARRRPGPALMLAVLLGLGLSNVFPLIDEIATERQQVPKWPVLFAAGGVDAAEYVEARSDPDDIMATNMHCKSPTARKCDNRHFWLSAYSERRVVIEGWGYTAPTTANFLADRRNSTIPNPYPRRLTVNDAAFTEPSARTVSALVDAYGVDWLFVAKKYDADVRALSALTGSVEQVFDNSHYAVFRVVG